jgi:hypothetical protein
MSDSYTTRCRSPFSVRYSMLKRYELTNAPRVGARPALRLQGVRRSGSGLSPGDVSGRTRRTHTPRESSNPRRSVRVPSSDVGRLATRAGRSADAWTRDASWSPGWLCVVGHGWGVAAQVGTSTHSGCDKLPRTRCGTLDESSHWARDRRRPILQTGWDFGRGRALDDTRRSKHRNRGSERSERPR